MVTQDWIIQIWGVRGSMPAACRDTLEYGGNTSCISVDCGDSIIVFDAGSGLTALGRSLSGHRPIHLFISHVHADHLLGLFIFPPFYDPGAEIHLYGEARSGISFRRQLETIIGPPYWPVGFADFNAHITFHETGPDQHISLPGGKTVRTMRSNHPNQCLLYRLDSPDRSVAYTLDCELTGSVRPAVVDFCRGADVIIWDGCYTAEDLTRYPGWGHSSWQQGAAIRQDAGAKLVLMTHYHQTYTDAFLQEQERLVHDPGVRFAREMMEVHI